MRKSILALFVSIILLGNSMEAGVVFLMIYPGSRPTGMGGAYAGIAEGPLSTYYNDGGIAFETKNCATFQHVNWLMGLYPGMYYEYAGYIHPMASGSNMGFAFTYITTGETEATDATGNTIARFRNYDLSAKVSFAKAINEKLGVGVGFKFIFSFLAPDWIVRMIDPNFEGGGYGQTWALDAGVLYKINKAVRLGAALSNFGPNIGYVEGGGSDPIPRTIRVGVADYLVNTDYHRLIFAADLTKIVVGLTRDFHDEWFDTWKSIGIEYTFNNFAAFRAGYFVDNNGQRIGKTFGIGIAHKTFSFDISADNSIYSFDTSNYRLTAEYRF